MAKTNQFTVRVNPELKKDFFDCCKKKGLTGATAINFFVKRFIESGNLPFALDSDRGYAEDRTLRMAVRMDDETREKFSAACDRYGLPMSIVVRGYMDYCVTNNRFPYGLGEAKGNV